MGSGLDSRVAFITGGRRGIGRAIAKRLAAQGTSIVIGAEGPAPEVDETIEMFERAGQKLAVVHGDLSNPAARGDTIALASEAFGPIDILVNNAACNPRTNPSMMTLKDRRWMFEINFHSAVDLIQQALPSMRERGYGRILNILSGGMFQAPIPYPGAPDSSHSIAVYGASKVALERVGTGLARELHGTNICVNGLRPHRVCVTEANSKAAIAAMRGNPEVAEGLEMMAEAGLLLIKGSLTGVSVSSRELLFATQSPLMSLDGSTVIGDANTLPDLG